MKFAELTAERWPDLERLFGERGACGGCWCMWWRLSRAEWNAAKGEANRQAFRQIVHAGPAPGVLAYRDGDPVGWCAVAPRDRFVALERSRNLKALDDVPVWAVTCLFVRKDMRGRKVSVQLLRAAADFARTHGGRVVEGYPVEPKKGKMPDAFAWTGTMAAFHAAGFVEVARRGSRPIVRMQLAP
ncbi:MAG: GNAT family N-acetyltransferase [Bryobacterales bacterium]|nr:GNAT family N-acetyltransferase [Bryobacterales bacterium]